MKILWFSNCRLCDSRINSSGTWLETMAEGLLKNGIQLFNITQGEVNEITEESFQNGLHQWILPLYNLCNDGLPGNDNIKKIQQIASEINPELIQVWGMEAYWGLLTARGFIRGKIILEIQGILGSCAEVYYGGVSPISLFKHLNLYNCRAIKRFSCCIKKKYEKWFEYEKEMLAGHSIISTQSDWVRSWIAPYIPESCQIVNTDIIVRKEFLQEYSWSYTGSHKIFVMMASLIPYKGLHDVIDAFMIVKKKFPDAELLIAGKIDINSNLCSTPDYVAYIRKKILDKQLLNSIKFVGPLKAGELVQTMKDCALMVHSSYVESYSLALAESLCFGIPSVVSFAGAMPELAVNNKSALFYSPGDYRKCASQILKIIGSKDLSVYLSTNAKESSRKRNNEKSVIDLQMAIFDNI